jgi:outer membrane protein OmpA-like peptidoglycan-associated protein
MKVTFLKSLFVPVVVLSLSFLIGCAGFEYAPKKNYLVYHKELPQAERAVDDAALAGKNKQCPDEFNEAKTLMEKAYETYWACRTQEAIAMAKEARGKALALCPPPPTCELTAAPKDIELEQSSTLTMKTAGKVKTALLDGTTVSATGGTKNVTPPNTMPYLAHVAGPGGSGTCSATVTVTIPPAPSCELTAAPKEIEQGQSSTLTLKAAGKVKSSVIDGTSVAPAGGTKTVSPADTTSYIAQCSGPGGSTVSSATVTVTVTPPPPPTCELSAAPKEIEQGQSSTLTLKTGGKVKSATLDGTAVSPSGGTKTINPANSSVYIAQCSGPGGSTVSSAAVTVLPPPPPTAELTAAPKQIEQGQSSTLTLKTGGKVKSAVLDGTEVPSAGGTKTVSPANTTSYIAQASGPGGSALSTATVTVTPPPAPTCELTTSPKEIAQGQSATLTLKTGGKVKSAVLDGTEVPSAGGTKTVSPKNTSPYMAQVSGPGGSAMCSTTVSVTPPPPPPAPTVMDRMIIHINFDFNKSEIRNIDKAEMQRAINFVRKYPVAQITVEGHTDDIGTEQYNQSLSERRAAAVKKYLVKEGGVDETKITTIGYGETKPVTLNNTAEGRAANRRAEILVLSK